MSLPVVVRYNRCYRKNYASKIVESDCVTFLTKDQVTFGGRWNVIYLASQLVYGDNLLTIEMIYLQSSCWGQNDDN